MTIGFDASRAFVEGKTGTENYSYQLLKALAKIDISRASSSQELGVENNDIERYHNQYIVYLRPGQNPGKGWPENFKFKTINFRRLWTQAGLALQTFIDPLDLLFVPSHTLPLIRKPGLKTVITIHDLGAEYLPGFHQLKQVLYLKLMTYYQLKTASGIIAVSEATKKDLVKKIGIPSEKIKVIYEGVDKNVFKTMSKDIINDIVKKYDVERGKYFLFVGTIQPRKNLERLIKAFSILVRGPVSRVSQNTKYEIRNTNFKLVLVGQKGWKSDSIYSLPKELGIQDQVKFLPPEEGRTGRVTDQDLVGLYNGALALVYPSLFEGFGLPIIEAFACGCPVITSNISSMPEVAGEAAMLVNPSKVDEITNAMLEISSNDELRAGLIQKGYNRNKSFDWEKCTQETVEIFNEVMKKI